VTGQALCSCDRLCHCGGGGGGRCAASLDSRRRGEFASHRCGISQSRRGSEGRRLQAVRRLHVFMLALALRLHLATSARCTRGGVLGGGALR
jgi:hypothetical protein